MLLDASGMKTLAAPLTFVLLSMCAVPSSHAARAKAAPVVALTPPEHVQARLAAKGKTWRPLDPKSTASYVAAIAAHSSEMKPRAILSLGSTGPEHQFYVVYPGFWYVHAQHSLMLVSEEAGGGLAVRAADRPTALALSPHAAMTKAANRLTHHYTHNPRANFIGATAQGSLVFMAETSDRLAEVPVFANAGQVRVIAETDRPRSLAPGPLSHRLLDAGLELVNGVRK